MREELWWIKAEMFCRGAHGKQRRKYTGEPYFNHCVNVANLVAKIGADIAMVQASLLHDTLEDTAVSYEDIFLAFGKRVADLVVEVSEVSKPEDGNRAVRKELDRQHYAKSSPDGATIKLADLIDNTGDIARNDIGFAKIYLPEKRRCLEVLKHGDSQLYNLALNVLEFAEDAVRNPRCA